jgi:tetratricopeptide (TPR) repeat protein
MKEQEDSTPAEQGARTSRAAADFSYASPGPLVWGLSLAGILMLLAHLAVSFDYSNWFWGFNHYFFLPRRWSLTLIVLGCGLCIPWVWSGLATFDDRFAQAGKRIHLSTPLVYVIAAGLLAFLFWQLRMPLHFLGDGRLLIRTLEQGDWFHPHEPLDRLIHHGLLQITRPVAGWNAEMVYQVLSVAAGLVYIFAALRLGALLGRRLFVVAFLLTLGTVQLFLGYAESYSLATAAILVYMVLALEHLTGRRRLLWVALSLCTGVALHHALVFLVPSFLYLIWKGTGDGTLRPRWRLPLSIGSVMVILVLVLGTSRDWMSEQTATMLVPWSKDAVSQYTLISWQHLVDFLNEQVLISPFGWVAAVGLTVAFWKDPVLRRSPRFRFLIIASAFPLAFSLAMRPGLGGSRDWDLWSLGSLPYIVAAACWLARGIAERRVFRFAAAVIVVVGFFHVLPWTLVNRSAYLSVNHFDHLAEDNRLWTGRRIAAARAELASHYLEREAYAAAAGYLEQAVRIDPDKARYWRALGTAYFMMGKMAEAEARTRRATELNPDDATAYNNLGRILLIQGRTDEAEAALHRCTELDPTYALAHFNLGNLYQARGEMTKAVEAYRLATEARPGVPAYLHQLALALEEMPGRDEEAVRVWKQLLEIVEDDPSQREALKDARAHLDGRAQ